MCVIRHGWGGLSVVKANGARGYVGLVLAGLRSYGGERTLASRHTGIWHFNGSA